MVGINIEFNTRRTGRYFIRLRQRFPRETKAEIKRTAKDARKEVRRRMSGPVLNIVTGRLWRSVYMAEKGKGSRYRFDVGTPLDYGRAHETGYVHARGGNRIAPKPIWGPVWRWADKKLYARLKLLMERLI